MAMLFPPQSSTEEGCTVNLDSYLDAKLDRKRFSKFFRWQDAVRRNGAKRIGMRTLLCLTTTTLGTVPSRPPQAGGKRAQ